MVNIRRIFSREMIYYLEHVAHGFNRGGEVNSRLYLPWLKPWARVFNLFNLFELSLSQAPWLKPWAWVFNLFEL